MTEIKDLNRFWNAYKESRLGLIGLAILLFFVTLAVFAPYIAPYDPHEMFKPMEHPGSDHLLGTNDIGQDILSELIYGARVSLFIAFFVSVVSGIIGTAFGLLSGYFEMFGFFLMRIVDAFLAIPRLPLIIVIAAFMRPSIWNLIFIFIILGWPITTRIIRSEVLSLRTRNYVEAARMVGAPDTYILMKHILPNVFPLLVVRLIIEASHVIIAESSLSFLGLGDPTAKSWGMILHYAFVYPTIFISDLWMWWMLPAGLCITFTILSLTFIGYALEELVNPRLRGMTRI
ncbi:MAG: ABC transporter permease [Candidatus Methanophagaceae archaeon]|nr:MAG: ABC transporter permease [Methanophagales archaeon]